MVVILMVIAGVVVLTALAIAAYFYFGNTAVNEAVVQRCLIQREQRAADLRMQRAMQDTVEQMFKAVRDDR